MTWYIYALIPMVLYTVFNVLSRVVLKDTEDTKAFAVLFYGLTAIFNLCIGFFESIKIGSITPLIAILTAIVFVNWGIFGFLETNAKKHTEISTFMVLVKIGTVLSFILSVIFLKEVVTLQKVAALVIMVGTMVVLIVRIYGLKLSIDKGFIYSALLGVILGIGWTIDKVVAVAWGAVLYSAISSFSSSAFAIAVPPIKIGALKKQLKLITPIFVFLAIINAVAYFFFMKAMTVGEVSKVVLIMTLNEILTIIAGIFFLGEKSHWVEKIVAGAIIVSASFLLL
jgi:drug/metabolite transporter (DMT)-like permease